MPTEELTVSYQQPTFEVDLTPVDVTLQFNAAGAGPMGPPGQTGLPGASITGPSGPSGPQGLPGAAATVTIGSTVTLSPGSPAQVTNSGTPQAGIFNFGVPQGPPGTSGAAGSAATLNAGTTTTGAPGTSATVSNSGSPSAAVFDFVIPQGAVGPQGPPGGASANTTLTATFTMPAVGSTAVATVANASAFGIGVVAFVQGLGYLSTTAVNTGTNQLTLQNLGYSTNAAPGSTAPSTTPLTGVGPQGPSGPTGSAATISVGTTTTGAPGTAANVTQSGTPQNATLSFTIPRGDVGATGTAGSPGLPGAAATIGVGTTSTLAPGAPATVTNVGSSSAAVFNFGIPQGVQGPPGVGDMTKAVYDTNNDGIVDTSAAANAVPWTGVTSKPATFPGDWNTTANKPATFPPASHAPTHNLGGSDAIAPDWTQVQNKPTNFAPSPHAPSHISGGTDVIALAGTSATGLLNQLSGNATDYVNGQNACQPLAPTIWSVRLRSFNSVGNCNFEVDQINCNALVSNAVGNKKTCDRWMLAKSGTLTATVNTKAANDQIVLLPGTNFCISNSAQLIQLGTVQASLAANDNLSLSQNIEGNYWRELSQDVTSLSLLVLSTVAPLKFSVAIRSPDATRSICKLCTIPTATWTLIQLPNIPVPSGGNFSVLPGVAGYRIDIVLACGTTFMAPANDVWQNGNFIGAVGMDNWCSKTSGSNLYVGFIQHEPGPQCTTLIDKPFSQNYDECLRYYCKSYSYPSLAGTVVNAGRAAFTVPTGFTSVAAGTLVYPKPMAKAPTVTFYSDATGAAGNVRDQNAGADKTGSLNIGNDRSLAQISLGTAATAGSLISFHYAADTAW